MVVDTQHGLEAGQVVIAPREIPSEQVPRPLRPVVRLATAADLASREEWKRKEADAFSVGLEKIQRHKLPMRLIDAEYTFDGGRLTFYFSAEGRVDFRELVKDLASHFRTRIDLRQMGSRDVARMVGGIGPCGLPTCCSSFMMELRPVTLRMAKEQGLALNPEKLSGLCGRLMCCLSFELDRPPAGAAAANGDEEAAPAEGPDPPPDVSEATRADPNPAAVAVVSVNGAAPAGSKAGRRRRRRHFRHRRQPPA